MEIDRFIIRKGDGIYDLYDFINAAMSGGDYNSVRAQLNDDHHALEHTFTGVEGDAAYEALGQGLGDEQTRRTYHAGPQGPNDQNYVKAFREMVKQGMGRINEAVRRQNDINMARGIQPMPEPFKRDSVSGYSVDPRWGHKAGIQKKGQKLGDGGINPWDPVTGELVTTINSGITGKGEAWLRPYFEGLDQIRAENGGPQAGQGRKPTSDEISAHRVHRNVISINDTKMGIHLTKTIQEAVAAAQQTGQDPMQAAMAALSQNRTFRGKAGGIQHRAFEEISGRYSPQAMQQYQAEQEALPPEPVGPNRQNMIGWLSQLDGNIGHYLMGSNYHYVNGPGLDKVKQGLIDGYGYSEETVGNMIEAMHNRPTRGPGKMNAGMALATAIHGHEMADGVPPNWAKGIEGLHMGANNQPLTAPSPTPQSPAPEPAPAAPAPVSADPLRPSGGGRQIAFPAPDAKMPEQAPDWTQDLSEFGVPAPPQQDVAPQPRRAASEVASPPPQIPHSPPPNAVGTPNALGVPTSRPLRAGAMESLGERLGSLYGRAFPAGIFGKTDQEGRDGIESLLEQVQMDIAKNEIGDVNRHMSHESPVDIAMLAADMNRPASDVVSVIYSRGDWRNIAKSFNMEHHDVQRIKVTFNG